MTESYDVENGIFECEREIRKLIEELGDALSKKFGISDFEVVEESECGGKHFLGKRVEIESVPEIVRKDEKAIKKIAQIFETFFGSKVVEIRKSSFDKEGYEFWFEKPEILSDKEFREEYPDGDYQSKFDKDD